MGKKKYIKYHKKKNIFKVEQSNLLTPKQGFYGLKAVTSGILSPNQLETARRIISKITKRSGKIVMKITFEHALTKKTLLSRMGKGTGSIHSWITYIKEGKIILELLGISEQLAFTICKAVCKRLPIQFEIVEREITDA